jgi:hypothetical protein
MIYDSPTNRELQTKLLGIVPEALSEWPEGSAW